MSVFSNKCDLKDTVYKIKAVKGKSIRTSQKNLKLVPLKPHSMIKSLIYEIIDDIVKESIKN
jgi:hypothetical protein